MPLGCGKKGGVPPRKKKKLEPITVRLNRFSSDVPSSSFDPSSSQDQTTPFIHIQEATSVPNHSMCTSYYNNHSFNNSNISYSPYTQLPWMLSPYTSSLSSEVAPFNLWFISGNISKCGGCNNKFVKPVIPPFDLCIQHKEWRSFTHKGTDEQQSRFANTYYHVHLLCIQRNWPCFQGSDVVISVEVAQKLTDVHKNFMASIGFPYQQ